MMRLSGGVLCLSRNGFPHPYIRKVSILHPRHLVVASLVCRLGTVAVVGMCCDLAFFEIDSFGVVAVEMEGNTAAATVDKVVDRQLPAWMLLMVEIAMSPKKLHGSRSALSLVQLGIVAAEKERNALKSGLNEGGGQIRSGGSKFLYKDGNFRL